VLAQGAEPPGTPTIAGTGGWPGLRLVLGWGQARPGAVLVQAGEPPETPRLPVPVGGLADASVGLGSEYARAVLAQETERPGTSRSGTGSPWSLTSGQLRRAPAAVLAQGAERPGTPRSPVPAGGSADAPVGLGPECGRAVLAQAAERPGTPRSVGGRT
jgi:hypothetical protein